jgi:hypothetical protein
MHKYTDRPLWRWIIWEGSNAKPRLITARRPADMIGDSTAGTIAPLASRTVDMRGLRSRA